MYFQGSIPDLAIVNSMIRDTTTCRINATRPVIRTYLLIFFLCALFWSARFFLGCFLLCGLTLLLPIRYSCFVTSYAINCYKLLLMIML